MLIDGTALAARPFDLKLEGIRVQPNLLNKLGCEL